MERVSDVATPMKTLVGALLVCLLATPGIGGPRNKAELINTLKTRTVSVDFDKASLKQFVAFIRDATGVNIVVMHRQIEKDGGDPEAMEITLKVNNVKVIDVLRLVIDTNEGMGLAVKRNVLLITSKKASRGKPVLVIYNVADALIPIRDFPAPDMNIYGSNYEPPEPPEPEVNQAIESSDELAEMVRTFTGRDTWEDEKVGINVFRRHLFIRQYPHVHREIQRFLNAVRTLR
jgi:hypothetical protein